MKNPSNRVCSVVLLLPELVHAHSGSHAGGEFAAWLRHMLFSPDHLPALIVAGMAIAAGIVLSDRRAARRKIKSLKRLRK